MDLTESVTPTLRAPHSARPSRDARRSHLPHKRTVLARQQKAHRLRHIIGQLAARLPDAERNSDAVPELAGYGCKTTMHVVRLLALQLDMESHTKDIDFSLSGIMKRWDAGYAHTKTVLDRSPWIGEFDSLSEIILHEQMELPAAAE